jgi:uncharacterized membrane protein YGL010W
MRLLPQRSLQEYLELYAKEHKHIGTKLTHFVGIPMIVASFPVGVVAPPAGVALFAGGWALQFVGHYVFEKNQPAFFGDPYYLLVGPVWVAAEAAHLAGLPLPATFEAALANAAKEEEMPATEFATATTANGV